MKRDFETMLIIVTCSLIGLIIAMILRTMYYGGVIIDALISGSITLTELMLIVIILWILVGVLIGALRR